MGLKYIYQLFTFFKRVKDEINDDLNCLQFLNYMMLQLKGKLITKINLVFQRVAYF